jgi:hypothetical protein
MKKNGLCFLTAAILVAMVSGACMSPLDAPGDPVEYDAQGRRLVTVTVNPDSVGRAVNVPLATAYIDFYEVVFVRMGTPVEYYSATTTKGAGKTLSLRVPAAGTYKAYLNAGHLEDSNNAVLLAQAAVDSSGSGQPISGAWEFTLTALKLQVNGPTTPATNAATPGTSHQDDPIYVKFGVSGATINVTDSGIPYYKLPVSTPVQVIVTTGVENVADYDAANVSVIPLGNTSPLGLPALITTGPTGGTGAPSFAAGTGILQFGFDTPGTMPNGLSNIGFDVSVALVDFTTRNSGVIKPMRWHIRNGLDVENYDNGKNDITDTGAGLVFAWGTAVPVAVAETTGVSIPLGGASITDPN